MMSNILTFIRRIPGDRALSPLLTLSLTAEERTRSHHRFDTEDGAILFLRLPRGTVLKNQDYLEAETGEIMQVQAQNEDVITVKSESTHLLLQAAYHLGNRHVALEINVDYLRFLPDPVLENMLQQLGVTLLRETTPFCPEQGAYYHGQ